MNLEEALRDVILEWDDKSDLTSIVRWAKVLDERDSVLTFNYDLLVERALAMLNKTISHATGRDEGNGIRIFKLHGSIDWIVADRRENLSQLDLLFDKENANRTGEGSGDIEDDCRLWRCQTREQLRDWIGGRVLQALPEGAWPRTVGIAGLGAYKQLHQIPGLGRVWASGMRALYEADIAVVVGFSMSDFDAMAQMQFAEVARKRQYEARPLRVIVIDPFVNEAAKDRFRRVFRTVEFVTQHHETVEWASF